MSKVIEVIGLSKSFGKVQAVKDICFYVEEAALFSFLGTNGAGKSTTISILLTLLQQDQGEVKVKGYTVGKQDDKIRKEIGVVFQDSLLDPLLTVQENLEIRGSFYGLSRKDKCEAIGRVTALTGLQSFLNRPYGKLSGGERRRTDIARALIHNPSILIMDEPTTGLDAQSRKNIWNTIIQLQKETKMTVFLTTHYIEEAAGSDYVVVMKKGEIIAKGTPDQLKNEYASDNLLLTPNDEVGMRRILAAEKIEYIVEKSIFCLPLKETKSAIPFLVKHADLITSFEVRKSSLDDVFITINGKDVEKDDGIH
jgi:multidrug/hemolysin transport system ATP-binding protein